MNDRKLLLAAIRENPEEDTPRLAYADCLDETGDAFFADWAAVIRLQVEAARLERYSARWLELCRAQVVIFERRKKDMTLTWGSRLGRAAYRRGFQEAHQFYPAETFLKSADFMFAGKPLRAVSFLGLRHAGADAANAIVRHPGMEAVETLDLTNNDAAISLKLLRLIAPRMPKLRALGLGHLLTSCRAAADVLMQLALPNLAALDLSSNSLFQASGPPTLLFHSPVMSTVRWLDLSRTAPPVEAVSALAHSPVIHGLKYLNLGTPYLLDSPPGVNGYHPFGADGAEALAAGPAVRGVEVLNLGGQRIGTHGLTALLRSPLLSTVRELNLDGNDVGDEGAELLASSPHVEALRRLTLSGNGIGVRGAEALAASPHLPALRILNLGIPDAEAFEVRQKLRERFPDYEPTLPGLHGSGFFEPIP